MCLLYVSNIAIAIAFFLLPSIRSLPRALTQFSESPCRVVRWGCDSATGSIVLCKKPNIDMWFWSLCCVEVCHRCTCVPLVSSDNQSRFAVTCDDIADYSSLPRSLAIDLWPAMKVAVFYMIRVDVPVKECYYQSQAHHRGSGARKDWRIASLAKVEEIKILWLARTVNARAGKTKLNK